MDKHTQKVEKVVVIAASAGGINALLKVFSSLPADLPAAILVVQHLQADQQTHLPEYLTRNTPVRVCLAQDGLPLEVSVGYIAVPGKHLRVENGSLILSLEEPVRYLRPSADILFTSAAQAFGSNVIGVILSGTGQDGTRGCQEIKKKGGVTIAQDEKTSRYFTMPKSSIEAGIVDYVLPLTEIAERIVALVKGYKDSLAIEP